MGKIIRLKESELKKYIKNVIAEQGAIGNAVDNGANTQINATLATNFKGKNIQLYGDEGRTTKGHLVQVIGINLTNTPGRVGIQVKDLEFISTTGAPQSPDDNTTQISILMFDCRQPGLLVPFDVNKKMTRPQFCPAATQLINKLVGCQTINKNADFASTNKGGATANFA